MLLSFASIVPVRRACISRNKCADPPFNIYTPRAVAGRSSARDLVRLNDFALKDIYAKGTADNGLPEGDYDGTLVFMAGTPLAPLFAVLLSFIWSGKICDSAADKLINKWGPFGTIQAIPATICVAPSWSSSGGNCVEVNYSTRGPFRFVRDEIRNVAPGLYLGLMYVNRILVGYFVLSRNLEQCRSA